MNDTPRSRLTIISAALEIYYGYKRKCFSGLSVISVKLVITCVVVLFIVLRVIDGSYFFICVIYAVCTILENS